jgi:sugar lactone lactonase YvrE
VRADSPARLVAALLVQEAARDDLPRIRAERAAAEARAQAERAAAEQQANAEREAGIRRELDARCRTIGDRVAVCRFNNPRGVASDAAGNVYVADTNNHIICRISAGGMVTLAGMVGWRGNIDGEMGRARLRLPMSLACDLEGGVYFVESGSHAIRRIQPDGSVVTVAGSAREKGSADGMGTAARFNEPWGIVCDPSGNLCVTDSGNHTVRRITQNGQVSTFAGQARKRGRRDGAGVDARFNHPQGIARDSVGRIYVADTLNNIVRRITPDGLVDTLTGYVALPSGVACGDAGEVYVASSEYDAVRRFSKDGQVTAVQLHSNSPEYIALDAAGGLYVAERRTGSVRRLSSDAL